MRFDSVSTGFASLPIMNARVQNSISRGGSYGRNDALVENIRKMKLLIYYFYYIILLLLL